LKFIADICATRMTTNLVDLFTILAVTIIKPCRRVIEVSNSHLRMNTQEKWVKSSTSVKIDLDPPNDLFGKGPQVSVYINSKTCVNLDSTGFATLCLDFHKVHW
jgi:hypothetical protein